MTAEERMQAHLDKQEARQTVMDRVQSLHQAGYSNADIAQTVNINESSVRSLLVGDWTASKTAVQIGILLGRKNLEVAEGHRRYLEYLERELGITGHQATRDYWASLSNREKYELMVRVLD